MRPKALKLAGTIWLAVFSFSMTAQLYVETTLESGVECYTDGLWGAGGSTVDIDGDGDIDLTLCAEGIIPVVYLNNGDGTFTDSGLSFNAPLAVSTAWIDFDNDNDLDLFICQNGGQNRLYERGEGLQFTEITQSAGIPVQSDPSYGQCWGDVNNDGWLDVYISNYVLNGTLQVENVLLLGNPDSTFTDITDLSGTGNNLQTTYQSVFVDLDMDGDQDLFVANDRDPFYNYFYRNNGDSTFTDVSFAQGVGDYIWSMSATVGDVNRDGFPDLYICNNSNGNLLKINNGDGSFSEAAAEYNATYNAFSWGGQFYDADNDGWEDLYAQSTVFEFWNSYGDCRLMLQEEGSFVFQENEPFSNLGADSYAAFPFDMDGDGDLDLISHSKLPVGTKVWRNELQEDHWIDFQLQGVASNSMGIGSTVELWTEEGYQKQFALCGESYLVQRPYGVHFGLGQAEAIDSVKVNWPSGNTDWFYPDGLDTSIVLTEGASLPTIMVQGETTICPGDSVVLFIPGYASYSWTDGSSGQLLVVDEAGSYGVTVTDDAGNTFELAPVAVESWPELDWQVTAQPVLCHGELGALLLSGADSELITWEVEGTQNPASIPPGTYPWTALDINGCGYEGTIELVDPGPLESTWTFTPLTCYGDTLEDLAVAISGGTPDYTINAETLPQGGGAGLYQFTVSDANGCMLTTDSLIASPPPVSWNGTTTDASCFGVPDGTVTPDFVNATGPVSLDWSVEDVEAVAAGMYAGTGIDSLGCTAEFAFVIGQPDELVIVPDLSDLAGDGEGWLEPQATGGTEPYTFEVFQNGVPTDFYLTPGDYVLTVTDANGCMDELAIVATRVSQMPEEKWGIHPNPAGALVEVTGDFERGVLRDLSGKRVATCSQAFPFLQTNVLPDGVYALTLESANRSTTLRVVIKH